MNEKPDIIDVKLYSKLLDDIRKDIALAQLKYNDLNCAAAAAQFELGSIWFGLKAKDYELITRVKNFLIESRKGFAFLGRQYHLEVGNKDFYIDLLFYHINLRCFVVVELKTGEFEPRDAGQLNFYLTAIDKQLKQETDNPTIGLLLVKTKDNLIVEYALQDINKPMGVAGYETKLVESLPKEFKSSLPTIEEIEAELESHKVDF